MHDWIGINTNIKYLATKKTNKQNNPNKIVKSQGSPKVFTETLLRLIINKRITQALKYCALSGGFQ